MILLKGYPVNLADINPPLCKVVARQPNNCMVLVMSYLISSAGLNLQGLCHNLHLFSPATSGAIQK